MPISFPLPFPLPFRLGAFYCAHFIHVGLFTAYFPLYLAGRGFGAVEIAWVLALPHIARTFAPAFWGQLADRTGALRALVVLSCAATAAGFAALAFVGGFVGVAVVIALSSLVAAGGLPLVEAITLGALAGQPGATARSGCGVRWALSARCSPAAPGSRWCRCRPCHGPCSPSRSPRSPPL